MSTTPIVILTGFLGAGKTTLLKRCLLNTAGLRIALVRNEFTAAEEDLTLECPILLKEEDEEEFASFWELPNSCVCCTLKSQFMQGISKMVTKARSCGKPFDLVMVEISGVADPIDMASSLILEGNPEEDVVRLGGVISVIDMARIDKHLDLKDARGLLAAMGEGKRDVKVKDEDGLRYLLLKQICSSDLIILNKRDLVEGAKVRDLEHRLSEIALEAIIIPTEHCSFDLMVLKQLVETGSRVKKSLIGSLIPTVHSHPVDLSSEGISVPGLMKYVWRASGGKIDIGRFEESLLRFVWSLDDEEASSGAQLFRAKGILVTVSDDTYEVQLVGDSAQITPVQLDDIITKDSCCLFVGINLPTTQIDEALSSCIVKPTAAV